MLPDIFIDEWNRGLSGHIQRMAVKGIRGIDYVNLVKKLKLQAVDTGPGRKTQHLATEWATIRNLLHSRRHEGNSDQEHSTDLPQTGTQDILLEAQLRDDRTVDRLGVDSDSR